MEITTVAATFSEPSAPGQHPFSGAPHPSAMVERRGGAEMQNRTHTRRRGLLYGLAFVLVAAAVAAPTAAGSIRPYANPVIDGGYGVAADPDSTPLIGGEKAYGFELPSPTSAVMLRSLRGDGLLQTPVASSTSDTTVDWSSALMGLAVGVALSVLLGSALVLTRRHTTTVAHS